MLKRILAAFLLLTLLLPTACAAVVPTDTQMRGVWVSAIYNLDYPSKGTTNADTLRKEADTILNRCAELGFNTVFLQVRPTADAYYKSDIYPWSRYLTGKQGTAPSGNFDPLTYWVAEAHKRGMELHAWINPYRVTRAGEDEWQAVSDQNPAKQHPDWVIHQGENYYFDPAVPEVRQMVVDGALEIVNNYDVDGIHLDDYFYPEGDFDDAASITRYGAGFSDLGDWRRNNVNLLISALNGTLHKADADISFGVSPAGIWDNAKDHTGGSATDGYSSYAQSYADSLYWVENGLVDYICPQVYWEIGFEKADFEVLLDWWSDAVKDTGVKLYIGIADYRSAEATDTTSKWYGSAEIERQLAMIDTTGKAAGTVHFRFGSVDGSQALSSAIKKHFETTPAPVTPSVPETPQAPSENTTPKEADPASLFDIFSLFLYSITHA